MTDLPRLNREDRLLAASLHGRAGYHVNNRTPHDEAVEDLRQLATVAPKPKPRHPAARPVLRADLLSRVAGQFIGVHRADPLTGWMGPAAAQLLVDAGGTDNALGRASADEVGAHVANTDRNPGPFTQGPS